MQPLEYVEDIINKAKGIPAFEALRQYFPKEYEFTQ